MNKPDSSIELGQDPFLNAVLCNPIELPAIVEDVVLPCTRNAFVVLKERNRIKKLMSIIVLILSKENLLQGSIILVFPFFQRLDSLGDRLDAVPGQPGEPVASRDMIVQTEVFVAFQKLSDISAFKHWATRSPWWRHRHVEHRCHWLDRVKAARRRSWSCTSASHDFGWIPGAFRVLQLFVLVVAVGVVMVLWTRIF